MLRLAKDEQPFVVFWNGECTPRWLLYLTFKIFDLPTKISPAQMYLTAYHIWHMALDISDFHLLQPSEY